MPKRKLKKSADIIANEIRKTDTEKRGDLFRDVAYILRKNTQYYTASSVEKAAQHYRGDI